MFFSPVSFHFFFFFCEFPSFCIYIWFVLLPFFPCLFLVSHLCLFFRPFVHPHHLHPPLCCSCVHFVPLKFIELAPTAET